MLLPVSLIMISLIFRLVHWLAEQERLSRVLASIGKSYLWECLNCGTIVMGTIYGPHGGSSCPKCGGVMVLVDF